MSMNPRLLRPRASGFNPRSISGLALWLDASSTDTLYTTDAGAVTAVSSPLDIAGCVLWLDGADASTVTASSGSVSEWRDKTAGARHFTASSTAQPTYTATLNGRNVLTFNGSTNTMTGNAAAQDAIRNRAGYTFFAVSKVGSVAAGERLLCGFGATVIFRAGQTGSSPYAGGRRVSGDTLENITGAASSLAVGSSYITSVIVNHTSQSLTGNLNGPGFASDTTYMAAGTSENTALLASVGSQSSAYGFYNGDIAEVIIFDTALSTADRARVEAYLAAKWGISGVHAPATATNDPVGYWGDKSGNGRHAVQATAANRPTISATTQNSKRTLAFDGSNDAMAASTGGQTLKDAVTVFGAYLSGSVNFSALWSLGENASGRRWSGGSSIGLMDAGWYFGNQSVAASATQRTGLATWRFDRLANTVGMRLNGTNAMSVTASPSLAAFTSDAITIGSMPAQNEQHINGRAFEILAFSRALSDSECRRVESYLASKWGIALAPQVSNADAQDWVNRVYSNGGTVSTATAAAVNTFCESIASAGIRDRFYRLNLFCGNSDSTLAAVRTPLYRGQSLTGTQFGNTTDTNNNFVAGDYSEASGLKGNGSNKYLETGLAMTFLGTNQLHMFCSLLPDVAGFSQLLSARANLAGSLAMEANIGAAANRPRMSFFGGGVQPSDHCNPVTGRTQYLVNFDGTQPFLVLGRNVNLNNSNNAGAYSATHTTPFFVFAGEQTGTGIVNHTTHRIDAYSIGAAFTSTAQRTAFHNAMSDFRTALGRT